MQNQAMVKKRTAFILLSFLFTIVSIAQTTKHVTDHLKVPGPIVFEKKAYNLSWSSHPAADLYKQEYLVKGDKAEAYKTMLLIDVITGDAMLRDIVVAKMAELNKLKATNPLINYQAFDNSKSGEFMLDFIVSANDPDGHVNIVERNVYRYKILTGKTGILLFGVSTRSYGAEIEKFLIALKTNKNVLVNAVGKFQLPQITIPK